MSNRKTGKKYRTNFCGRCEDSHSGYSGKLDRNNVEYVVCGVTHKRMNISGEGIEGFSVMYPTNWIMED
jgi:hypothetical protein